MSRFQQARQNFREKVFGSSSSADQASGAPAAEVDSAAEIKEEQDVARKERGLKQLLYFARKKYVEQGLEGSIEIYSLVTVFTHSISCDVSNDAVDACEGATDGATEAETAEDASLAEDISRSNAHAISAMDGVIRVLKRRAGGYRNTSFKNDVTLSSGVYVTLPFLGLASISVTFSASVKSLLAAGIVVSK
jgi:hypothetical protein